MLGLGDLKCLFQLRQFYDFMILQSVELSFVFFCFSSGSLQPLEGMVYMHAHTQNAHPLSCTLYFCPSSKIAKCTIQAVDHFEDNDGNLKLGTDLCSWQLCCWKVMGVPLLAEVAQGLWLHARSLY